MKWVCGLIHFFFTLGTQVFNFIVMSFGAYSDISFVIYAQNYPSFDNSHFDNLKLNFFVIHFFLEESELYLIGSMFREKSRWREHEVEIYFSYVLFFQSENIRYMRLESSFQMLVKQVHGGFFFPYYKELRIVEKCFDLRSTVLVHFLNNCFSGVMSPPVV